MSHELLADADEDQVARIVGDFIKNIGERLQNLDRALPKLAAVSLGIASLGSVALSSIGGIFRSACLDGASLGSIPARSQICFLQPISMKRYKSAKAL